MVWNTQAGRSAQRLFQCLPQRRPGRRVTSHVDGQQQTLPGDRTRQTHIDPLKRGNGEELGETAFRQKPPQQTGGLGNYAGPRQVSANGNSFALRFI